jgi:hypothetical protein
MTLVLFGLGAFSLAVLAVVAALWYRRRCSHCSRRFIRGLTRVKDFHEIADCSSCRSRALAREQVGLCHSCYRSHVRGRSEAEALVVGGSKASA